MKRILRKVALFGLPSLVVVWFVGDFVYSRVVQDRMRRWESSIEYSPAGVRAGCQAYSLGSGDHALLLVHGFNDSPACFYQLAPALAARGFACRVMRLPGLGTTTADYATSDHRAWLRAIDQEVQALRKQHEHVSVVAHSMGGALAIRYLVAHPNAVESVVLLAPAVAVNNERSPLLSARAWHSIARRTLVFTRMVENIYPVDAHSAAAQSYPFANRFVPQRASSEFFAVVDGVEECADRFQVPLLTVLTKDDLVIDWRAAERFHRQAASVRKELCFIDDAGHVLPFDNGWERIVQEITQFVRAASARLSPGTKEVKSMTRWMLQTAKNKFSEVLERARKEGPQMVTRRGVDTAVVLSIEDYLALSGAADSDLVDFFRKSPLREISADLRARTRETGREIKL